MAARIALVLRSGGEYGFEHVVRLAGELFNYGELIVLTDFKNPRDYSRPICDNAIPLKCNWPGWWSKLELMRPDIEGDLLYLDLDTRVIGNLSDIRKVDKLTMLADPYRPNDPTRFGSGVMYLPEAARRFAWERFIQRPRDHMAYYRGDQDFLAATWARAGIARWQDLLPGQLVSYKCDVRGKGVPSNARIVYFHGKPRPWDPKVTEL